MMPAWLTACLSASLPVCFPPAGADRVKEALQALGLKCGGTLRQRAERLMSTKGRRLEELDKSLFAKGAAPAVSQPAASCRLAGLPDCIAHVPLRCRSAGVC
jgi:hypothetical protein